MAAYSRVGYLHLRQGNIDKAIPLLERTRTLAQEAAIPIFFRMASRWLACAYARSGRTANAVYFLESSLEPTENVLLEHHVKRIETYLLIGQVADTRRLALYALDQYRTRQMRGWETWTLWLLGEIAMHGEPPEVEQAKVYYQQAMALADELGMRPLQAHCHHGLGRLYLHTHQWGVARPHLSKAIDFYRDMQMTFWLPQAEAQLITSTPPA